MADLVPNNPASGTAQGGSRGPALDYGSQGRREKLPRKAIEFLKALGWVAPLTILIWIYAEREQSMISPPVAFPVEIKLPEPNRVVRVIDPPEPDHNLVVVLAGPRTNMDRVIRAITTINGEHPPVVLTLRANLDSGVQKVSTTDLVAANPIFAANGISVHGTVAPAEIRVIIDDLEEKDIPVQAPPGLSVLGDETSFSPAMVRVRAPKTVFESAAKTNSLRLIADLTRVEAIKQPGHHDVPSVPLKCEFQGPNVSLATLGVRASFDVKQAEQPYTVPSLTVFLVIPSTVQDRFKVNYPTTIANVKVAGPAEMIAKIKDETVPVRALLYIDVANLVTGRKLPGLVKFDLPEGVHLADDATKQRIEYELAENAPNQ